MKKLIILIAALAGLSPALQAQTLLYQWNFTNTAGTTLTSSVPSYALTPGTGELFIRDGQGIGGAGTNGLFTNGPSVGPGAGPGGSARGALVLTGQGYNGTAPTVVTFATNLNIGQRLKFTMTYWFQFGDRVGNQPGITFPRLAMLAAGLGYDSGSSGTGVGIGTSVNNWTLATDPTLNGLNFAGSIQTGNGNNSGIISARLPVQFNLPTEMGVFTNGIRASDYAITNDNHWYFVAVTFDGTLSSGHVKTWLGTSATNVVLVDSQNAAANMLPQANFTTNAVLFLGNRNNGNRPLVDGTIADVRIYAGVCNSNNLEAIRTFSNGFVDDGSGESVTAPVVQLHPKSGSTHVGLARTFEVQASGLQPLAYQWKTNNVNVPNATNATFTLSNIPLALNGAAIACTITNLLGSTNSTAATLTVVPTVPGSYAEAVVTNSPFVYWHLNETTNGVAVPTDPVRIFDYASGLDGTAVDPGNTIWNGNSLAAPLYPGFSPANTSIQAVANGNFSRLDMAALPRYTNDMTICGWIRVTNTPTSRGLIYSMNNGNQGAAFGHGYGLVFGNTTTDVKGNLTCELSYNWSVNSFHPATYASSLAIPVDEWTFVALTIDPEGTNATLYMGSHSTGLQVSIDDTNFTGSVINGTSAPTAPIILGRSPYSFFEQGQGSAGGGNNVAFNDVAVFYKALSPSTITNLYLVGAGVTLNAIPDPNVPGNLLVTYPMGTLQSSTNVLGTYVTVPGATSPYSEPMTNAASFYRLTYP